VAPCSPPPASLRAIADPIDGRLREVLEGERIRWTELDARLAEPLEALTAFVLDGGKRLRPAFCHWAFVGAGGDPADPVWVEAGCALELLHAFALIHDDVMDGSDLRRNRATVHRDFEHRHRVRGWGGEGRRFGDGAAILLGDMAFVYADLLVADVPPAAQRIFTEMRAELNVGQYLDLVGAASRATDDATARRIARYKSAKYTVERPLHLGAALAGRPDLADGLTAAGIPLGDAFQLRDDLLGVFGERALVGKPVGDDLREGKPTPLLVAAVRLAHEHDDVVGQKLLQRVGDPQLTDDDVATLGRVLRDTGAVAEIEAEIGALVEVSVAALDGLPFDPAVRHELAALARYVAWRTS
jgi:geranylgeranyl diphosphate synthase type I